MTNQVKKIREMRKKAKRAEKRRRKREKKLGPLDSGIEWFEVKETEKQARARLLKEAIDAD